MVSLSDNLWDSTDTDGTSEDWLARLISLSAEHDYLETPAGVLFTRRPLIEGLFSHPALKVPITEQYDRLGVSGPVLERLQRVILGLDGPEHLRMRKLVNKAFTRRAVEKLGRSMEEFLSARLDRLDGTVDFLGQVVGDYPAAIIGGLLGLPPSDHRYLASIAEAITNAQFSMNVQRAQEYLTAAQECDAYLGALVTEKRRRPADAQLSAADGGEQRAARLADGRDALEHDGQDAQDDRPEQGHVEGPAAGRAHPDCLTAVLVERHEAVAADGLVAPAGGQPRNDD